MRKTTAALVVLAVAVAAAALTIALDWGWYVWIAALLMAAAALVVAALRFRPVLRTAAVVAAVALVAAGVLVVRIPPINSPGWEAGEGTLLIAANDKLAVTLNQETHALQGRAIADGGEVWENSFGGSDTVRSQQLGGDFVLLHGDSGSSRRDDQAAVVSISDGKTRWSENVGQQQPFTTNGDVVVFSSNETITGIEVRTGKKLWTQAGGAHAGSGGQSSYNPRRWVPRSDWVVIRGSDRSAPLSVLNVQTGRVAATLRATGNDFVVAGKTLVEFGYDSKGRRSAKGTPLAGGRPWQAEFRRSNGHEVLEVVDGKARALYDNRAVYLEPETGEVHEVPIEDRWTVNWYDGRVGGRYVAVEKRDRDREIVAWGVADTVTGKLVNLGGRGRPVELTIEQYSGDTAISRTTVVDAVGAESNRYSWISNGSSHGQVTIAESGRVESAADVVQVGGRIVVLRQA
ncbi:outer membrane protein assembly factor BamB family protein [Kribbella sp. CA-293567]|uniref:outer membrane protein assembly factor BamB family protein n=1 Tax=Kribbella sp. CA-293567 TaxID=3002436 RepID=UPI0022DE6132|nr:PQQ-binding-like beta-propeller repeat protein [Kribbella sp. CA-293567]WBQ07573.1 PQQ-binding-like beta-propeller repeat protein [Kribbella sp. CA-293567]